MVPSRSPQPRASHNSCGRSSMPGAHKLPYSFWSFTHTKMAPPFSLITQQGRCRDKENQAAFPSCREETRGADYSLPTILPLSRTFSSLTSPQPIINLPGHGLPVTFSGRRDLACWLLSPATKWKGDIGLSAVRPSDIPSFRHSVIPSVCPEIVSGA